jgi:hypothetical protein
LTGEYRSRHLSEDDLQREARRGDQTWAMQRVAERAGELAVADRMGRGGVHGSDRLRRLDDPPHQLSPVQPMDPRLILTARSQRAAREEPERQQHPLQCPAGSFEDETRSECHDARARPCRALGFFFPCAADLGEEVAPGWC